MHIVKQYFWIFFYQRKIIYGILLSCYYCLLVSFLLPHLEINLSLLWRSWIFHNITLIWVTCSIEFEDLCFPDYKYNMHCLWGASFGWFCSSIILFFFPFHFLPWGVCIFSVSFVSFHQLEFHFSKKKEASFLLIE